MRNSEQDPKMNCVSCSFTNIISSCSYVLVDAYLKSFVQMNPNKSAYAFGLNRKRAGHFNLCFLANKGSVIQTWVSNHRIL